jgi:aldehyde dehydrogenase (NAD+)
VRQAHGQAVSVKTKRKPSESANRSAHAQAGVAGRSVVPLSERRLNFGSKWEYAPALEEAKGYPIAPRHELFINGKFTPPASGKYFASLNPATEEVLTEMGSGTAADVDAAVKSARRAYERVWSKMPARERGKYLYRIARVLQERARELAVLETLDGGKPIKETRDIDLPLAAAHFFYHAGWADKLKYAFPGRTPRPLGVAGQIIPWNFPLLMAAWKLAPALACGNTVVLKPAETTSLTALRLAEILQAADLPAGVVNIVTGGGDTGAALVNHPGLDKLAFTGSTEVGKAIALAVAQKRGDVNAAAAGEAARKRPEVRVPRLTLELGGKGANIIFEDASLDQAIEGIIAGIYFNQGHVCCAGSRLLVQEGIHGSVIKKLRDRIRTLRLGDPLDKNTDIGAINNYAQLQKIRALVQSGVDEGAQLVQPSCRLPERGYWYPPTFLTGVTASHRVAREEIFGPVLSVMTFRTPEEAIERANNTPYGLSAGVWTDKGSKILKLVNELRAGVIWANSYNKFDPASPFGGYKESGFGREGGLQGLAAYCRLD